MHPLVAAIPALAVILIGLATGAALAVFVVDTGRQINLREGR